MLAMILKSLSDLTIEREPLEMATLPDPVPDPGEVLLKVAACGVCHTELDEIEGRTPPPHLWYPGTRWSVWWNPWERELRNSGWVTGWEWPGSTPHAVHAHTASGATRTSAPGSGPPEEMWTVVMQNT